MSLLEEYEAKVNETKKLKVAILVKVAKAVNSNANGGVVAFVNYEEDRATGDTHDCVTFTDFKRNNFIVTAVATQLDDYGKCQVILRDDHDDAHKTISLFKLDGSNFVSVSKFIADALGESI